MSTATLDTQAPTDLEIVSITPEVITEAEIEDCWRQHQALHKSSAATSIIVIPPSDPVIDLMDVDTPRDTHTRLTLGQKTKEFLNSLFDCKNNQAKNHGHRNTPLMKKRGDVAKKRRIAWSHQHDDVVRIERIELTAQLEDVPVYIPAQAKLLVRVD